MAISVRNSKEGQSVWKKGQICLRQAFVCITIWVEYRHHRFEDGEGAFFQTSPRPPFCDYGFNCGANILDSVVRFSGPQDMEYCGL